MEGRKLAFSLICEHEDAGHTTRGYAAGHRHDLTERFSLGAEALGQFKSVGEHELLLAAYAEPNERFTVKFGIGTGLGPDCVDLAVRTGVVWRF